MSLVTSKMIALGSQAPAFNLYDTVSGKNLSLTELKSDVATVILFICNHCPFVHHINEQLVKVAREYQAQGVQFIGISSNDVQYYPQDGPEMMQRVAQQLGYPFPYLYDATQEVAKSYQAECTPDLFVFDGDLKLAYRGQFDDTRPRMGAATGKDLTQALDAIIAGQPAPTPQYPSMGCSIKWK